MWNGCSSIWDVEEKCISKRKLEAMNTIGQHISVIPIMDMTDMEGHGKHMRLEECGT